jgi:hypothetical protein
MKLLYLELEAASPIPEGAPLEPSLDEILKEPIVRRLMARDGVTEPALRRLISNVCERLSAAGLRTDEMRRWPQRGPARA